MAVVSADALFLAGARQEVAALYPLYVDQISNGLVSLVTPGGLVQQCAGLAAAAGGKWNTAEKHFETALRQAHETPDRIAQPEVRRWYASMLNRTRSR